MLCVARYARLAAQTRFALAELLCDDEPTRRRGRALAEQVLSEAERLGLVALAAEAARLLGQRKRALAAG